MEHLFNNENYIIEDVKTISIFNPKRWAETFGKSLTRNIIEAKIIHTLTGLTIPLKRYSSAKDIQVIEFAGLRSYDVESKLLKSLLIELIPKLQQCKIKRIDICFDYPRVPNRIIKKLCSSGRESFQYKNTIYYKTEKEKKSNSILDIKRYNKQIKENLIFPMERLEFVFKGAYFENITLNELDKKFLSKMEKTIFKFSGINSKIISIS
ncbi:hypothetical protein ACOTVT_10135 [Aliarcobacter butzleri]